MAFENFPYADFHALNLDWLLKKVRQHDTDITKIREEISATNLPQIVKDKLMEMVDDGTLAEIIETTVFDDLNNRVTDLESKPVVEWYGSTEDLESSTAPVGATVVCNGENYIIQAENNGYGIETVNGWATPLHITDHLIYSQMDHLEYNTGTLADDTTQRWMVEGGCYNSTLDVYAFLLVNANNGNKLVTMKEDGTIVGRVTVAAGHANDMCWVPEENAYYIVPMIAGEDNILVINPDGTLKRKKQVLSNGYPTAIGYDPISKRVLCYSGNYRENDTGTPVLLILDIALNEIKRHKLTGKEYYSIIPNNAPFTASQGGCCVGHNFVISSSVFFDDGYQKSAFRLTQINTETGKLESYFNGLFPSNPGVAIEAEALVNNNGELKMVGYYNANDTTAKMVWQEVSTVGQGSWR